MFISEPSPPPPHGHCGHGGMEYMADTVADKSQRKKLRNKLQVQQQLNQIFN